MMYSTFRICERFGKWPHEFDELNYEEQRHLIAYERVRETEDVPDETIV